MTNTNTDTVRTVREVSKNEAVNLGIKALVEYLNYLLKKRKPL